MQDLLDVLQYTHDKHNEYFISRRSYISYVRSMSQAEISTN